MKIKLDLDLVMYEFGDAFREEPERGIGAFEALLADHRHLMARITYLERLQARLPKRLTEQAPTALDFRHEIDLIATIGLESAWQQGRLAADQLAALVRDPQALRALHDRLVSVQTDDADTSYEVDDRTRETDMPAASAAQVRAHHGSVPEGLTTLAHRDRLEEFEERLMPWVPYLLDELRLDGQDEHVQAELMRFIRSRLPELGHRQFSKVLPHWLREFTNMRQPLPDDFLKRFVERAAVRRALEQRPHGEPAWVASFRRQALHAQPDSPLGLLHFQPRDVSASTPSLESFRRTIFGEAKRTCEEGLELFELN